MKLRPFQEEAVERIVETYLCGKNHALLEMAPGSGKTAIVRMAMERVAITQGALSVAWVDEFDAGLMQLSSKPEGAAVQFKVTYFKFSQLLADLASGAVSRNAFDVLVFMEPARGLSDFERVMRYFAGFKLVFTAVPSIHPFFKENQESVIYKYSFQDALMDGEDRSIALQSTLQDLNDRLREGFPQSEMFEGLKLAEQESRELREILTLLRQGKVSFDDIRDIQEKKSQLEVFRRLLDDEAFFSSRVQGGSPPENVWQVFFQENLWIFGFGLNYLFNTPLQGGKLERVVAGHSVKSSGKRVDALLSSNGIISSLCFAEIKTHKKALLRAVKLPYRPGAWAISDELAGGIAQLQRTVQESMENLKTSLSVRDKEGYDCGEKLYMYKPKSFLVIGSLAEFTKDNGIHESKFSSFQMFRNALSDVEVITFDELYERAKGLIGSPAEFPLDDDKLLT